MKKLFFAVLVLFVSLSAFASDTNKLYFGIEGGTYSYREPHMDTPIHDYGNKIGASFEWVGRSILSQSGLMEEEDNSFATFELRYLNGKVDYDGFLSTTPPTPYKTSGEIDWYIEGRITFGETYDLGRQFELWPYLGFGYRYLVNDGTNVSSSAYKRVSQYWYIPVGAKVSKTLNNGLVLTLTGEFDWLMVGKQSSDLSTDGYVDNCQPEGWGIRFGIKAEAPVSKKIGVFVEPYYLMWKIQNSTNEYLLAPGPSIISLHEPFNITKEAGIRAGIYF